MSSPAPFSDDDRRIIASVRIQVDEADARLAAKPASIGQYAILEVLGRGGMGVVYKAEQPHTHRVVALKVLRPNLVSKESYRRFEKEARVLGRLHHIGIAQIYEGGMADTGGEFQPFFAMELVDGLPLTDHCEANKLNTSARLELLARVCDAVEHAHQNSIIHRDLKPSNILVDSTGQPKVLDFGVARATDADLQAVTLHTEAKKLIGTLPYMSPEQVRGDPHDVDTRSDVYALGVLGYRMLTGRYPFNIARHSIPDAARAIQEDEPIRLSLINRHYRGDIETIILKALEKEKKRRYQSCVELAADIRRFLNHEPIHARPAGRVYRFRKFAERNKILVATLSVVMSALLIGFILSSLGYRLYYQRLEEIRMLASAAQLHALREEAANIGAPTPASIPKMESWLDQAAQLRPRINECRQELRRLHERFLQFTLKQDFDRRVVRLNTELRELRDELNEKRDQLRVMYSTPEGSPGREESILRLNSEIAEMEVQDATLAGLISTDHVCIFQDPADRLQHDALLALERDLLDFFNRETGVFPRVARSLEFARVVEELSVSNYAKEWAEAARSTADASECPAYREITAQARATLGDPDGTWLHPHIGLVPLGRDPHSGLWEFCHIESGRIPERDAQGNLTITCDTGVVLVLLPGGTYTMGAVHPEESDDPLGPNVDPNADRNERPLNVVTLQPFFISKYEMTLDQWKRLTLVVPWRRQTRKGGLSAQPLPADLVSWSECDKVLWSSGLLLPTEAQWEYAARAGTTTPWWTGRDPASLSNAANLVEDDDWIDGFPGIMAPVGRFRPNAFGIHDTIGNVSEWCYDALGSYRLPIAEEDGRGRRKAGRGEAGYRVFRGGSLRCDPVQARVSVRGGAADDYRSDDLGVRPAMQLRDAPSINMKGETRDARHDD